MILKQDFFEGAIKPGQEAAFYAFVDERLMPVWRAFPGLASVAVMRGAADDDSGRRYPLHTMFRFVDRDALAMALSSPERARCLELVDELMTMFEGRLTHIISEDFGPAV